MAARTADCAGGAAAFAHSLLRLRVRVSVLCADPITRQLPCPKCAEGIPDWCTSCPKCDKLFPACIITGRSLIQVTASELATCKTCKHKGIEREMRKVQHCPLCHSLLR